MNRVTMADPKTFSDAIRIALREESLEDSQAINVVNHGNDQQRDQMTEIIGLLGKLLKKEDGESQRKFGGRRNNKMANGKSLCNYCEKPGHFERKCWKKHPHLRPNSAVEDKDQGN